MHLVLAQEAEHVLYSIDVRLVWLVYGCVLNGLLSRVVRDQHHQWLGRVELHEPCEAILD